MREIKYRQAIFRDGEFNHWHYWGYVGYQEEFVAPITIGQPSWNKTYEVKDSQQYTGSRCGPVSVGARIYEGDIVEKWSHCSLLERLSPLYNRGIGYYKSLTFTVRWSEQGLNYNIYPHFDDSYWKVIGNIYENKELLVEK